jgi:hypothetical protein
MKPHEIAKYFYRLSVFIKRIFPKMEFGHKFL